VVKPKFIFGNSKKNARPMNHRPSKFDKPPSNFFCSFG